MDQIKFMFCLWFCVLAHSLSPLCLLFLCGFVSQGGICYHLLCFEWAIAVFRKMFQKTFLKCCVISTQQENDRNHFLYRAVMKQGLYSDWFSTTFDVYSLFHHKENHCHAQLLGLHFLPIEWLLYYQTGQLYVSWCGWRGWWGIRITRGFRSR